MATQISDSRFNRAHDEPACNVIRLPTAAPRKVDNSRFKEQREAAMDLREHNPFVKRYIPPHVRAAMPDARLINAVAISPELLIATALLELADPETRAKVATRLAPAAGAGSEAHNQALAIMRRQRQKLGDSFSFQAARIVVERDER